MDARGRSLLYEAEQHVAELPIHLLGVRYRWEEGSRKSDLRGRYAVEE